jgi:predicted AlkP superfamily pyrophosphatase or phosphodiesterase
MTSVEATKWIADATIKIDQRFNPTLSLVYLPHLDYCLQRTGTEPNEIAKDLSELDAVCGSLIDHFLSRGSRILIVSEYGVMPVRQPIHLNRLLREHGLLSIRTELGLELLDAGESVAHIYVNDQSKLSQVRSIVEAAPGVDFVLDDAGKREQHLDHSRSGELIAVAKPDAWFTYYYWLDDAVAPDFARTVDIHRKPGYDPVELYLDPAIKFAKARTGLILLRRKLGQRPLMSVIPLDATLVKGSHGRAPTDARHGAIIASSEAGRFTQGAVAGTDVFRQILDHVFQ